jgi:hypothetical protein
MNREVYHLEGANGPSTPGWTLRPDEARRASNGGASLATAFELTSRPHSSSVLGIGYSASIRSAHPGRESRPLRNPRSARLGRDGRSLPRPRPRLERDVAVKVLPSESSADSDRLRRFEQESKAAGALNHPNILAVFDTGLHDGAPYIVFELLHGETLRERLKGPLTIRKSVDVAVQIAHGLAAAHAAGIVHRDLKPENIFVTVDGRVKILDFGLAKLQPRGVQDVSDSETALQLTDVGTVLGTAGYMSPEQVQGQPADQRSDVFSFGAVFHEMLSGRRAFHGDSVIETMRAILKEDPPQIGEVNRNVPVAIEQIVRRCLEKRPDERFHSAHDLGLALEAVSASTAGSIRGLAPVADRGWWRAPGRPVSALLALLVLASAVAFLLGKNWNPQPVPQFRQITFRRGSPGWARFSSDGQTILYSAKWPDQPLQVFSARLDAIESRALGLNGSLAATKGGEMAVVLPNGTLARLPLDGGVPREIADPVRRLTGRPTEAWRSFVIPGGVGSSRRRGMCCMSRAGASADCACRPGATGSPSLRSAAQHRVSNTATEAAGSVIVMDRQGQKTTLSTGWTSIGGLAWARDGREVWFTATKSGISQALYAVTLAGRERLVARAPGVLWLHDISADGRVLLTEGRASIEARGRMGQDTAEREYSWLDGTFGAIFSPDGQSFIFSEAADGGGPGSGAYLRHADGSPPVRLGEGWALAISPDGKWVVCSNIGFPRELRLVPTGAGNPRTLRRGTISEYDWAYFLPDGKRLVVAGSEPGRPSRLFVQDLPEGEPKPFTPEGTGLEPFPAAISPDGRFVAAVPLVGERRFALYPIGGGAPQPIPGLGVGDTPLRFSPDGASLYVLEPSESSNRVVRLDLASGRKTRWLNLAPPDTAGFWGSTSFVDITPDGRSYLYSYWRIVSDLFVVDGLK